MNSRVLGLGIVLALGAHSRAGVAGDESVDAARASYKERQLALYDALERAMDAMPAPRTASTRALAAHGDPGRRDRPQAPRFHEGREAGLLRRRGGMGMA